MVRCRGTTGDRRRGFDDCSVISAPSGWARVEPGLQFSEISSGSRHPLGLGAPSPAVSPCRRLKSRPFSISDPWAGRSRKCATWQPRAGLGRRVESPPGLAAGPRGFRLAKRRIGQPWVGPKGGKYRGVAPGGLAVIEERRPWTGAEPSKRAGPRRPMERDGRDPALAPAEVERWRACIVDR